MSKPVKLKPCPRCRKQPDKPHNSLRGVVARPQCWGIFCMNHVPIEGVCNYDTKAEAITAWNDLVDNNLQGKITALQARVDRLTAAIREALIWNPVDADEYTAKIFEKLAEAVKEDE